MSLPCSGQIIWWLLGICLQYFRKCHFVPGTHLRDLGQLTSAKATVRITHTLTRYLCPNIGLTVNVKQHLLELGSKRIVKEQVVILSSGSPISSADCTEYFIPYPTIVGSQGWSYQITTQVTRFEIQINQRGPATILIAEMTQMIPASFSKQKNALNEDTKYRELTRQDALWGLIPTYRNPKGGNI